MPDQWQAPGNLSRMVFGVAGPHATALVPRHISHDLILSAFQGGITAFDTGPSYGAGEAEKRLGAALRHLGRDNVFVSTKAGVLENNTRDFSPTAISRSLDRSLARLGCAYVDVLFVHGPGVSELNDALARVLSDEKQSGRVRALGMTGRGQEIDAALDLGVFDLLMAPVHAGLSPKEINRLVAAHLAGIGVVGIEVLSAASAGLRWPRSAADFWYCARALRHRKLSNPTQSVPEALRYALDGDLADIVMMSTTRQAHLSDALRVLDEAERNT